MRGSGDRMLHRRELTRGDREGNTKGVVERGRGSRRGCS